MWDGRLARLARLKTSKLNAQQLIRLMNEKFQWQTLERFVEIRSPWLTLIGEKLKDQQEQVLDYWRVEKADSVVIITIQCQPSYAHNGYHLLLPTPMYRPGLQETTLDFPGGRVSPGQTPAVAVPGIIKRELGVIESGIARLTPLNSTGWAINSSFSNQKLYGFLVELDPHISISPERLGAIYPTTPTGIRKLLKDLTCLQCRAVLLEWWQEQYYL